MGQYSKVIQDEAMNRILSDFDRLRGRCYIDNAGASMFPKSMLQAINNDLLENVYQNPHSDKLTADAIDQVRYQILKHFNTTPDEYTVVFTSGSTASLKLVAECFNFSKGKKNAIRKTGAFVHLDDNHTSVLGMREIARSKKVDVINIPHAEFMNLKRKPTDPLKGLNENALFVYPAENNFNGFKYPLQMIDKVKMGCLNSYSFKRTGKEYHNWYVMLDCACYVSTNKLDLSAFSPDFVCVSFYKIFGYPTGLGALLIKNESSSLLSQKDYFGGGTVDIVLCSEDFHVKRNNIQERLEDGTNSFLSILSLKQCFETLHRLVPRTCSADVPTVISLHTFHLAQDLFQQLTRLRHRNGRPAAVLYADSDYSEPADQGGIVAFNLQRSDASFIGYAEFQQMANLFNISLRTGCFCNNGSCQRHLGLTTADIRAGYNAGHVCGDEMDLFDGKPTGCIRVSFGYYNTFQDIDVLMAMICKCFLDVSHTVPNRMANGYQMDIKENEIKTNGTMARFIEIEREPKSSLVEIALFPIKSCGAFKPKSWKVGQKGLEYDREWMIIRDNGTCLTQKQSTNMCMIRPILDFDEMVLMLNYPGMPIISLSLVTPAYKKGFRGTLCQSKVCNDAIEGYDCGEEIGEWISQALGISFLRLIRQCSTDQRRNKNAENLSLSNKAQFLLVNRATVRWLVDQIQDNKLDKNLNSMVDRFRGNLIVDTDEELTETKWSKVTIGNHEFKVDGPCARCQMVCIDQENGKKTVEPLRTIAKLFSGKMRFGIYLTYVGTTCHSSERLIYTHMPVKTCE